MNRADIERALFDYVDGIVLSESIPKAYSNADFTVPTDKKYIEVIHFPNDVIDYAIDNNSRGIYRGILQLNVHYTSDIGTIPIRSIIDELITFFVKGTRVNFGTANLEFDSIPNDGAFIRNNNEEFIPLRMSYRSRH